MAKEGLLNLSSLKKQVYEYLRIQLKKGELKPGSFINMDATIEKLGISKTPLREALLQLEMEGFVTILPRRGILVNALTLQDIKDIYQIIGALESTAIISASSYFKQSDIDKMEKLNKDMKYAINKDNFNAYYKRNLEFHDIFISLSGNKKLNKTINTLKKRLYDFPRPDEYIKEWEEASIIEHKELIKLLSEKKFQKAAKFIRDIHWSYKVQEKYIRKYYSLDSNTA